VEVLKGILKPGDLFLTMGAGDNWKIGKALYGYYQEYLK
jgi:UDP-N-acetylmuramate--alanine ligase